MTSVRDLDKALFNALGTYRLVCRHNGRYLAACSERGSKSLVVRDCKSFEEAARNLKIQAECFATWSNQ